MRILCILACVLSILSPTAADAICKPDLGLVVDTTKSLKNENVPVLKEALTDLVQKFDISEDKTHVSLETFHKKATVHNRFNDPTYWSVNAVIDLINTSIDKLKSPTYLDNALEDANFIMYAEANGYRSGNGNVLLVFTDGRTNDDTDLYKLASSTIALEEKGVRLIAVAIGPDSKRVQSQTILTLIAGDNVVYIDNYQSLGDACDEIFNKICSSICKPNLGLVVDTTKSLGNEIVPVLKEALTDLVQKFDISEDKTHVSLETFHRIATVRNHFNDPTYWSVSAVIDLINTSINNLESPTRLDRALRTANDDMFCEDNGYRPGKKNILVVFTDGRTHQKTHFNTLASSIADLKSKGVLLIAIAIGPHSTSAENQEVLRQIAGQNVFHIADLQSFDDVVNLICPVPDVVPQ